MKHIPHALAAAAAAVVREEDHCRLFLVSKVLRHLHRDLKVSNKEMHSQEEKEIKLARSREVSL
jgi:hypothetical protein